VLYREYYEVGRLPQENVLAIHAASGNTRQSAGHVEREQGVTVPFYEEVFTGEKYSFSVMDGRTFAQPSHDTSMTIGNLYARLGLRCIPASGKKSVDAIPIVNEYFEMQEGRHHILVRMGLVKQVIDRVTGQPLVGAPRLYVFNTLRSFRSEIESYVYEQESDKPIGKNDHLMTALKYLLLQNPRYLGDSLVQHQEFSNSRNSYSEKMSLYTT
jgi:hypothetical protein